MELTDRQYAFFNYLKDRMAADGQAPSLRQAAADMGVSHTAVAQMIQQLEKKGLIERGGHYSRTLRLCDPEEEKEEEEGGRRLPLIGQVTAGLPMYAQQEWEGTVVVDGSRFRGDNLFCLRIKGDSMQGAGILDGDLVICEPRQYAENGEIVAALINGDEATVKRFYLKDDHIEMRPENPAYATMRYRFGDLLVQGRVIGVLRDRIADGTIRDKRP